MALTFHEDHIIDNEGRRWALECPWSPDCVGLGLPPALIRRAETAEPPPKVTATVTRRDGAQRCRVYLQGELSVFGTGWRTLKVTLGRKWARLEDARGRVRKIELDKFNLLGAEFVGEDDGQVEGDA